MFSKLEQIISLQVKYTTRGNLTIGTGRGDGVRDNLVIRESYEGNPVISGSSLKGVIRSTIEAILHEASIKFPDPDKKRELQVCVPMPCTTRIGDRYKVPEGRRQPCRDISSLCPACKMFGTTTISGRVIFHDAKVPSDKVVTTFSRVHVALTRDTKTASTGARGGSLQTIETVPAGVDFSGSIDLINPKDWMVGAIISTLELLPFLGVGAKKTSGYGELEICLEAIKGIINWSVAPSLAKPKEDYLRAWQDYAGMSLEMERQVVSEIEPPSETSESN